MIANCDRKHIRAPAPIAQTRPMAGASKMRRCAKQPRTPQSRRPPPGRRRLGSLDRLNEGPRPQRHKSYARPGVPSAQKSAAALSRAHRAVAERVNRHRFNGFFASQAITSAAASTGSGLELEQTRSKRRQLSPAAYHAPTPPRPAAAHRTAACTRARTATGFRNRHGARRSPPRLR